MNALRPLEHFRYCPRCAAALAAGVRHNPIECAACGFVYYLNPTVAVAAFAFRDDGRVLVIRRAKEPGLGKLAPPGGFIDSGETAEMAIRREFREEVRLTLEDVVFLCSQLNDYPYRGVNYPVLDLFFTAKAVGTDAEPDPDEVAGMEWVEPRAMNPSEMAFPSMAAALRVLQSGRNAGPDATPAGSG